MLDDKTLIELGRVAEFASALDFALLRVLSNLVSDDPKVGRAAFAKLQFSTALDRVVPLANTRELSDKLRAELAAWVIECRAASKERNALIHGTWLLGSKGTGQIRGRNQGHEIQQSVSLDDLRAASSALHVAYRQGLDLWLDITAELDMWAGVERELLNFEAGTQPFDSSANG
jgi:hypothetical protein